MYSSVRGTSPAARTPATARAAAKAGARKVTASEVDPFAVAAIALNAALNEVDVAALEADVTGVTEEAGGGEAWDLVLAGDVFYERDLARRAEPWLRRQAGRGATVLVGDPGRGFLPKAGLERIVAYGVKTDRALEDTDLRNAVVWRLLPR